MEILPVGENFFSIGVSAIDTAECAHTIRALNLHLRNSSLHGLISARSGLDCLLLECDQTFQVEALKEVLLNFRPENTSRQAQTIARVPVCHDSSFAPDLEDVAAKTHLPVEEVLEKFFSKTYEVWMIGFMPGYPYMGALDSSLQIARKETPSINVAAKSVAIADEYVGVYPFDSPGGWHVIGRTPVSIIDYSKEKPWLFDYGMKVEFYPISKSDFEKTDRW